jgi:hypothetical protein
MSDVKKPEKERAGNKPNATAERQQQHTGNHERAKAGGADRFGGTRAGAENVEPGAKKRG